MNTLTMSRRSTASNAVTRCLFACKDAQRLTNSIVVVNNLQYLHAELFSVLRKLRHQDTANQKLLLDAAITSAVALVSTLNGIVQAMLTPVPPSEDSTALPTVQTVVSNALTNLIAAQNAE